MITVKKNAIKYKSSDGMQSVGVLCQIGVVGEGVRTEEITAEEAEALQKQWEEEIVTE